MKHSIALTVASWLVLGPVALLSCSAESMSPAATVHYFIDAPLCSSRIPVQFFIDSTLVGTDTFSVNLAPDHRTSRGFTTPAGPHVLGARVVGGLVWPDRAVTLTSGQVFTDTLPFYCS